MSNNNISFETNVPSATEIIQQVFANLQSNPSRSPVNCNYELCPTCKTPAIEEVERTAGGDAAVVYMSSETEAMHQEFDGLETNRPKFSSSPNLTVLQTDSEVVRFADSPTLQDPLVVDVEPLAGTTPIDVASHVSPTFSYYLAIMAPAVEKVPDIVPVSTCTPEVRPESHDDHCSQLYNRSAPKPDMAVQLGSGVDSIGVMTIVEVESPDVMASSAVASMDNSTKPAVDERDPDTGDGGCSVETTEQTAICSVNPRQRRSYWSRTKRFVRLMFCCGAMPRD